MKTSTLLSAILLLAFATAADACTTFCTRGLFGRNYDFEIGDGMVVVNKRGVTKSFWTSQFGSVTFNQYGRDNPTGGMNDAGVVVELMWLNGTRYPSRDARPEVGTLGWIQYQLDTSGSVAEVIANAAKIRIREDSVPLHYLVADRTGDVATIEFFDGKLVVHRGASLPIPALANDSYENALAMQRRGAGDRFSRAAARLRDTATVDDAFAVLENVAQPTTRWSIVYDLRNLAVHYRTKENRERRTVRFAAFDFSCAKPVLVLDVDTGHGNVTKRFTTYTSAANLALVRKSLRTTSFTRDTPDAEIAKEAAKPDASRCTGASL